jgi:hypothetical protein
MAQSWIGIRVTAALAILGSVGSLLLGMLMFLAAFRANSPEAQVQSPIPLKPVTVGIGVLFLAAGGWGMASGIGLYRRREWARLSIIIFAVLLVGMGGSALIGLLFIRIPDNPDLPPRAMVWIKLAIAAFYGALTVIGVWWLLLFNARRTKEYFTGAAAVEPGGRPLSVTIIAWYLLLTAVATGISAVMRVPAIFFGAVLTTWAAMALYTVYCAVSIYLGTGLLQLQESARLGAIKFFAVAAANSVVSFALPGAPARFERALAAFPWMNSPQAAAALQNPSGFVILGVVFVMVPIFFLIRRRTAFA